MRIVPVDSDGTVVTTDKDADIKHTVSAQCLHNVMETVNFGKRRCRENL